MAKRTKAISLKDVIQSWLIWGIMTLCRLPLYGSLPMWAGYSIGSGLTQPPILLIRMPVGILMGILCLGGCMIEGILAAKAFGDGNGIWCTHALAAMAVLVPGTWSISVAVV